MRRALTALLPAVLVGHAAAQAASSTSTTITTSTVNLGPLTTTFTLAKGCLDQEVLVSYSGTSSEQIYGVILQNQPGGDPESIYANPTCYPPAYSDPVIGLSTVLYQYYSPAICPSGWSSASTGFSSSGSVTATNIACCPSGYQFRTGNLNLCQSTFATSFSVSCAYANVTSLPNSYSTGPTATSTFSFSLPCATSCSNGVWPFYLQVQASDASVFAVSTSSASASHSSTGVSSSAGHSSGLSTGAKIGIGLGVPIAVLAIAAIAAVCLLRRRHKSSTGQASNSNVNHGAAAAVPAAGAATQPTQQYYEPQKPVQQYYQTPVQQQYPTQPMQQQYATQPVQQQYSAQPVQQQYPTQPYQGYTSHTPQSFVAPSPSTYGAAGHYPSGMSGSTFNARDSQYTGPSPQHSPPTQHQTVNTSPVFGSTNGAVELPSPSHG